MRQLLLLVVALVACQVARDEEPSRELIPACVGGSSGTAGASPAQYGNRSSALGPNGEWAIVGAAWNVNPFPSVGGYDSSLTGTHAAFFRALEAQ